MSLRRLRLRRKKAAYRHRIGTKRLKWLMEQAFMKKLLEPNPKRLISSENYKNIPGDRGIIVRMKRYNKN